MSESDPGPSTGAARPRSKNGCNTCRQRKVKCDEQHPYCLECTRLGKECTYRSNDPPSFETASDTPSSRPRPLEPRPAQDIFGGLFNQTYTAMYPFMYGPNLGGYEDPHNFLPQTPFISHPSPVPILEDFDPMGDVNFDFSSGNIMNTIHSDALDYPMALNDQFPNYLAASPQPGRTLFDYDTPLPNGLKISYNEHQAIKHYESTFSLYRTTKTPDWSTHKVLFKMGEENKMIMHLLLAVSINDCYLRRGQMQEDLFQNADYHFQKGRLLFVDTVQKNRPEDTLLLMAAFFFLYLYLSKRKDVGPRRLRILSTNVLEFIRSHRLVDRCISTSSLPVQSTAHLKPEEIRKDRSVLSRLIIWTYDEDIKCSFQGTGGHLARYLVAQGSRTKEVYEASRNALGFFFAERYPYRESTDDRDNTMTLEFLYALMPLWQAINDLNQNGEPITEETRRRVEHQFVALEETYQLVFRDSSEITDTLPRPRVNVNADYDVILFNALRIYFHRSTLPTSSLPLSIKTPPHITESIKTLLTIIERTFVSKGTELHDRLQWPLFLAGIETDDLVYRGRILERMTSRRVEKALRRILERQKREGRRLEMGSVRGCFYEGSVELSGESAFWGGEQMR